MGQVEFAGNDGASINYLTGNGSIPKIQLLGPGNAASLSTIKNSITEELCYLVDFGPKLEVAQKINRILGELMEDVSTMAKEMPKTTGKMKKIDEDICSYSKKIY